MKTISRKILKRLAAEYGIEVLILFGSQAKKQQHKASDIDIAYLSLESMSLIEEARFATALMKAFGNRSVDAVSLRDAPPLLAYQIANHGKLLYEARKSLFSEFQIYAARIYRESRPLIRMREERLKRKIRAYRSRV